MHSPVNTAGLHQKIWWGIVRPAPHLIPMPARSALKPDTRLSPGLTLAGGITLAAWAALAWVSRMPVAPLGWMLATLGVAWGAVAWVMWRAPPRDSPAIWWFGLGFHLIALTALPVMEDDHHRFLWDGYCFATTGNPYAVTPQMRFGDESIPREFRPVLDQINHPDVRTIYGPLTQGAFRAAYHVAPARLWPWKLILLGAELAVWALLWPGLGARGRVLLAWCPLAVFESGFNAHPDLLGIMLLLAAWWLSRARRPGAAAAVVGLAVAAKLFAILLAPFLLWRLGWRAWLIALVAAGVCYAPFWLQGSTADLAGLRAMAAEWRFNSSVHALVAAIAPPGLARMICGSAFIGVWLALWRRWNRRPDLIVELPPGDLVYGGFLLLSAVANPWYCLWLWPFVAARPTATGLAALAAVSLSYVTGANLGDATLASFAHPAWLRPVEFGVIGLAALWDWQKQKARP